MKIESPAFSHGGHIPATYSRYGDNHSPPLAFQDIPPGTQSLALIVDDPDAPRGTFTHWIVYNIPPNVDHLDENWHAANVREGKNGWGELGYGGPRPPSGEHRYFFHLYALDRRLDIPNGPERSRVENAIRGHVLAEAECMGRFITPPSIAQRLVH